MTEHHVGELRLRLQADAAHAAQGQALRAAAEALVRAALERCADLLEAQAPGRVLLLRRLPLHWRLDDSLLHEPVEVAQLARSAAEAIESSLTPARLDPPPGTDGPVAFDDDAQWRASHLLARARGGPAWFHAGLEDSTAGDPLAILADPARGVLALATLQHLARADLLAEVLAAQPPLTLAAMATAWQCDAPGGDLDRAVHDPAVATVLRQARAWPALPAAGRQLALLVHASVQRGETALSPQARRLATAVACQWLTPDADADADTNTNTDAAPTQRTSVNDADAAADAAARRVVQRGDGVTTQPALRPADDADPGLATRAAGLFLLLARMQELGLAEALWQACLPEAAVLAATARALLGSALADDPAAAWIGGQGGAGEAAASAAASISATAEQAAEVAQTVCSALAQALPRRGLAELPPVLVSLAQHSSGRLLVAAAEGLPFAFFAWPADTRQTLTDGVRALLARWPHSAVLSAPPALAQLDSSGRLLVRRDPAPSPLWLPPAASPAAAALLAVVAGAPCTLLAARLAASQGLALADAADGSPAADAAARMADCVRHWFLRPGRLLSGPEQLDVRLVGDARDLALRRAGLDQDPGWMPWMRRHVRFIFLDQLGAVPAAGP